MKKHISICTLLGVTQAEIAILLGVTRSRWSMYSSGKRGLPLAATQLLSELLTHVQTAERSSKTIRQTTHQRSKMRTYLERLLAENNYQRVVVEKALTTANAKHDGQLRLLQVAEFLNNRPQQKNLSNLVMYQAIERRAIQAVDAEGLEAVIKLEIRKETLEVENIIIQSKLLRFTKNVDNNEVL